MDMFVLFPARDQASAEAIEGFAPVGIVTVRPIIIGDEYYEKISERNRDVQRLLVDVFVHCSGTPLTVEVASSVNQRTRELLAEIVGGDDKLEQLVTLASQQPQKSESSSLLSKGFSLFGITKSFLEQPFRF